MMLAMIAGVCIPIGAIGVVFGIVRIRQMEAGDVY